MYVYLYVYIMYVCMWMGRFVSKCFWVSFRIIENIWRKMDMFIQKTMPDKAATGDILVSQDLCQ